jgi:hypothetical protein
MVAGEAQQQTIKIIKNTDSLKKSGFVQLYFIIALVLQGVSFTKSKNGIRLCEDIDGTNKILFSVQFNKAEAIPRPFKARLLIKSKKWNLASKIL